MSVSVCIVVFCCVLFLLTSFDPFVPTSLALVGLGAVGLLTPLLFDEPPLVFVDVVSTLSLSLGDGAVVALLPLALLPCSFSLSLATLALLVKSFSFPSSLEVPADFLFLLLSIMLPLLFLSLSFSLSLGEGALVSGVLLGLLLPEPSLPPSLPSFLNLLDKPLAALPRP